MIPIIPSRVHGIIDYLFGILLIASPWLFHFNHLTDIGAPTYVVDTAGAAIIAYSSFTRYELTLPFLRTVSMKAHLLLDAVIGALLTASPWLFGFVTAVHRPHVVMGIGLLVFVLFSNSHTSLREPTTTSP